MFTNLLNNAAKFTRPGGRIEFAVTEVSHDFVTLSIRDNGIGVQREMLGEIFEMFTQVDRSHAQVGGGLGIGLTLARRLLDLHGGSVEARSDGPDMGSTFVVRLPLGKTPIESQLAPLRPARARSPASGRKILVADANADAAHSLAMILGLEGHDTRVAHDGEEAFAIATRRTS